MKVKDLKSDLQGIKIRVPKKYEDTYMGIKGTMYIESWWTQGVWLKKSQTDNRIYPLCMNPKELLEFIVVKE